MASHEDQPFPRTSDTFSNGKHLLALIHSVEKPGFSCHHQGRLNKQKKKPRLSATLNDDLASVIIHNSIDLQPNDTAQPTNYIVVDLDLSDEKSSFYSPHELSTSTQYQRQTVVPHTFDCETFQRNSNDENRKSLEDD